MKKFFRNHKWQLTTLSLLAIIALLASMITFSPSAVIKKQWGNVITIGSEVSASTTADFTATGTAAQQTATFQTALNDLPSSGGILNILSGTFTFNATVTRAIANVTIEGIGMSTIFTNNASTPIFTAGGNGWNFISFATDAGGVSVGSYTYFESNLSVNGTVYNTSSPVATAPTGRTASYVIAPSNATATEKSQADVVLTGMAAIDTTTIQNAFNTYNNIYFCSGTITTSTVITAVNPALQISGAGNGVTIWQVSSAIDLLHLYPSSGTQVTNISISNIEFVGNGQGLVGLTTNTNVVNALFTNVTWYWFVTAGVSELSNWGDTFINCKMMYCGTNGNTATGGIIFIGNHTNGTPANNTHFISCRIDFNHGQGVYLAGDGTYGVVFTDCEAEVNYYNGIWVHKAGTYAPSAGLINNCEMEQNNQSSTAGCCDVLIDDNSGSGWIIQGGKYTSSLVTYNISTLGYLTTITNVTLANVSLIHIDKSAAYCTYNGLYSQLDATTYLDLYGAHGTTGLTFNCPDLINGHYLGGTTSGYIDWSFPVTQTGDKKMLVLFGGYLNNTGSVQTVAFPFPFIGGSTYGVSVNTTGLSNATVLAYFSQSALTLPVNMGGVAITGEVIIEGQ